MKDVQEQNSLVKVSKSFRANITTVQPHFVQKVVARQTKVFDALVPRFHTNITIFIPKLKVQQTKPCVMLHVSNGAGRCMIRAENPIELAKVLEDLAHTLKSDEWFEKFEQITHISENLLDSGELFLDNDFVDVDDFKKDVIVE